MSQTISVDDIIAIYGLTPHIEGGFGADMYHDPGTIPQSALPRDFKGSRPYSNGLYYLLPIGARSIFHKLLVNEVWHFYLGNPLEIYQIFLDGSSRKTILGSDITHGQQVAYVAEKDIRLLAVLRPLGLVLRIGLRGIGYDY